MLVPFVSLLRHVYCNNRTFRTQLDRLSVSVGCVIGESHWPAAVFVHLPLGGLPLRRGARCGAVPCPAAVGPRGCPVRGPERHGLPEVSASVGLVAVFDHGGVSAVRVARPPSCSALGRSVPAVIGHRLPCRPGVRADTGPRPASPRGRQPADHRIRSAGARFEHGGEWLVGWRVLGEPDTEGDQRRCWAGEDQHGAQRSSFAAAWAGRWSRGPPGGFGPLLPAVRFDRRGVSRGWAARWWAGRREGFGRP